MRRVSDLPTGPRRRPAPVPPKESAPDESRRWGRLKWLIVGVSLLAAVWGLWGFWQMVGAVYATS